MRARAGTDPRELADDELRVAALDEAFYAPTGRLTDPLPPAIAEQLRRRRGGR